MATGGLDFENGSLFDRLTANCVPWAIYAGDPFPLVKTLHNVAVSDAINGWQRIRDVDELPGDLAQADSSFPAFTLIEPNYGAFYDDFTGGNSQHPLDSVSGGEALTKLVYESLRASPIWESSALIVTYDEHGGFYDHVVPPAAEPPGDQRRYEDWNEHSAGRAFNFDRLGVRVPAVVVSPLVTAGVEDTTFDHTSVYATLADRFGLGNLTNRDATISGLEQLFENTAVRDTPATVP
jgi:hypothetical protein